MIARTHVALASALYLQGAALFEYETDPVGWAIACAASLLPDADLSTSKLGRALFWLSTRLEKRFGHRTITHSVIAIVALALGHARVGLRRTRPVRHGLARPRAWPIPRTGGHGRVLNIVVSPYYPPEIKFVQYRIVDIDRNARLPLAGEQRTPLCSGKVAFTFSPHTRVPHRVSRDKPIARGAA